MANIDQDPAKNVFDFEAYAKGRQSKLRGFIEADQSYQQTFLDPDLRWEIIDSRSNPAAVRRLSQPSAITPLKGPDNAS